MNFRADFAREIEGASQQRDCQHRHPLRLSLFTNAQSDGVSAFCENLGRGAIFEVITQRDCKSLGVNDNNLSLLDLSDGPSGRDLLLHLADTGFDLRRPFGLLVLVFQFLLAHQHSLGVLAPLDEGVEQTNKRHSANEEQQNQQEHCASAFHRRFERKTGQPDNFGKFRYKEPGANGADCDDLGDGLA